MTSEYGYIMKKLFRRCHVAVENMLILEYESGRREAYVTARTTNGRCMTAKDAAGLMGEVVPGQNGIPQGTAGASLQGRREPSGLRRRENISCSMERPEYQGRESAIREITIPFCESPGSQAMISLCDGMGCGEQAGQESRQVVELTEGLLEAGFGPRAAFKLVNTVLLLAGAEQHPAALDVSLCGSVYRGCWDVMKLGAAPTFVLGQGALRCWRRVRCPQGS